MRITEPVQYSKRTVTRFLWLPVTKLAISHYNKRLNTTTGEYDVDVPAYVIQMRWLEFATWEQEYTSNGRSFPFTWSDKNKWIDKEVPHGPEAEG